MYTYVLFAMQVVFPSELVLVFLPGHISAFGSGASKEGSLLSQWRRTEGGIVGPHMLNCYYLRVQCIKGCMDAHGLCEHGIDLLFGDLRSRKRHQLLVGFSCRISRKLMASRKPYWMGC